MSIAERARELLEKQRLSVAHNLAWLEQALLAERRLAMTEILAEMDLDDWDDSDEWNKGYNEAHKWYAGIIRSKLDGVATPRGGE